MADDVAKLLIQVSATTELLRSNLNKAEAAVASFERDTNKRIGRIDKGFSGLGKGIGAIKGALAGFAGGAFAGFLASFSVGTITNAISQSLEFAGSLGEVAQSLGVGTKFLQEFRFAATQNGATLEQADTALGKFSITLGKAFNGNKAAAESITSLGLSLERLKNQSDSERYAAVADAIAKIKDPARQAASAVAIFGRGALAILPTLQQAGAGFRQSAAEAQKFGLILSDKQIQDADITADKIAKLKQALAIKIAGVVADDAERIGQLAESLFKLAEGALRAFSALQNFGAIKIANGTIPGASEGDRRYATKVLLGNREGRGLVANELRGQASKDRAEANLRERSASLRGGLTEADKKFIRDKRAAAARYDKGAAAALARNNSDVFSQSSLPKFSRELLGSSGGGGGGFGGRSRSLARDLKDADPLARQLADTMAEISRDAVDVGQSIREDWASGGNDFKDVIEQVNARMDDEREIRLEQIRQAADLQEQNIRDLAGLYEELFTGGTKGFLRVLKYEGIRAISEMLARLSQGQSAFGGGGGGLFGSLFSSIGSLFGGSGISTEIGVGFRAAGGPVSAGKPYIVGEKRPELFVPRVSGTIVPSLKGLGGQSVNLTINAPGATAETVALIRRELANAAPTIAAAASNMTTRNLSRPRI